MKSFFNKQHQKLIADPLGDQNPITIQVLEGEEAVACNRVLMGATDPREADIGTIRADFADSIDANAVHGSDSLVSANREISYFFKDHEIISRATKS